MDLDIVLHGVEIVRRAGPSLPIVGVEYDSRRIARGSLFVAMRGGTTDGNRFLAQVAAQGANAIVTDSPAAFDLGIREYPGIGLVQVQHGRRALARLAANFFAHPEAELKLTGVTGTNGKTTTSFLTEAMLQRQRRRTILVGTIEYHVAGAVRPSPHTTPESRDLFALFHEGLNAGATEAVMEVSSHALDQDRIFGLSFDVAIFTNLTRDHLDYHGSMEAYFQAKRRLFEGSGGAPPRVAVVNQDDEYGRQLSRIAPSAGVSAVFTYGMHQGDFRISELEMTASGMRFDLIAPEGRVRLETSLTGRVNVYNLLAASAAAMARGLTLEQVAEGAAALPSIPGRFQSVSCGQDFAVIVDYAHTDDALKNVLAAARDFVQQTDGRVITLFGCGGDRDRTKRPLMGRAAGAASDVVVLTSDNPRSEDPQAILDDVLPGLQGARATVLVEPDRERAIRLAIGQAQAGDLVLLAGKGHEKTQTLRGRVIPFDDVEIARGILQDARREQ
ncbi:MAG TPA: UDP-N-acetylmuramoyl-L-alanyl-D-glutamate--2,6-diaminopimelate ligase [Acidobacteriaceae bacterium]|nr:UDP-N-acetylmuramoyl-L-alanyl-D-glutamate--2,6-diaminopimelate ligase [Acidobacteriaceae bacterium]